MNDRLVHANDVQLCVETFGDDGDPAILLISGSTSSMDWWPDEFCSRLAAGLRFVIRYDHRDTGRSTSYPPGAPAYSFPDLVDDAVGRISSTTRWACSTCWAYPARTPSASRWAA